MFYVFYVKLLFFIFWYMKEVLKNCTYGLFFVHGRIWRMQYFISNICIFLWGILFLAIIYFFRPDIVLVYFLEYMVYTSGFFILLSGFVRARRLHDLNMSGWWSIAFWIASLFSIVWIILELYLLLAKWTSWENKYGIENQ